MRAPSTDEKQMTRSDVSGRSVPLSERPTAALIDLAALTHNFHEARRRTGNRKILAVVKAQAYGHGAVPVSRALVAAGADMLGVALVEEGRELREAGVSVPLLIMGAVFPEQAEEILRLDLITTLTSLQMAQSLSMAARKQGRTAVVHLKVDTGMGRIGLVPEAVPELINGILELGSVRIEGLMTHFSDADLQDKLFAAVQMDRFEKLAHDLEQRGVPIPHRHAANSAAVLDLPRSFFTMVRPGLMLYGYNPLEHALAGVDLRPVLSLVTRIAFIKRIPAGTPISYGRTFTTRRESLIATVPIGYADGYSRGLSNKGQALVRGRRAGIAGRVCMDMTMFDVTDIPGVREGDEVVLIGREGDESITAGDIAAMTGTIPYEVLCGISGRVPRVYIS
jgi:alanine racemase